MGAPKLWYPEADSVVDYFQPPEKRVQLNFKVPSSLKAKLLAVVRLWKVMALARGADPDDVDLTYVAERLLNIGVDGVWEQAGKMADLQGMPSSDEEWSRLEKAILKRADADRATRKK